MNKIRVYASLLLFSFLMGVRVFMPELAESIRARAFAVVDIEEKYRELMEVIGDKLNEGGLGEELVAVLGLQLGPDSGDGADASGDADIDASVTPEPTALPEPGLHS